METPCPHGGIHKQGGIIMNRHATATFFLALSTCFCAAQAAEDAIPLRILGRDVKAAETPITVGVPFADGAITSLDGVSLLNDKGQPVPFQHSVMATWVKPGSGSIKWALLDFRAKGLDKADGLRYTLQLGQADKAVTTPYANKVTQADGRVTVDTGKLRFAIDGKSGGLIRSASMDLNGNGAYEPDEVVIPEGAGANGPYFVRADGERFAAANDTNSVVTIEEEGAERVCVKVSADYVSESGERLCRSITRIHAYGGMALLRINHTFVFTVDMNTLQMSDLGLRFNLPVSGTEFGGADGTSASAAVPANLVQHEFNKYKVGAAGKPEFKDGGAPGWMRVEGQGKQVTVGLRDFWRKYPNELSSDKDGFTVHFWPAHNEVPEEPEMTQYNIGHLWFAHHGKRLDLKTPEEFHTFTIEGQSKKQHNNIRWSKNANAAGVARSFEIYLAFGEPSGAPDRCVSGAVTTPPLCVVDPDHVCGSKVYGDIAACDRGMFPETERAMTRRFAYEVRGQKMLEDYGKWIYGNAHTGISYDRGLKKFLMRHHRCWRNTHHGTLRGPWILYAHFGDPEIFDFAAANTEVNLDISFCHETVPGIPGSWGVKESKVKGGLCDYKGVVPWHSGYRSSYNSMVDFMLYYYYNTGNRWGLDVAMELAALRRKDGIPGRRGYKYPGRGWVGQMNTDLNLYRITGDEHFLKKAEGFLNKIRWSQLADGSFFNNWYSYAPALVNYYEFTGSPVAADVIVKWTDFFLDFNITEAVGFTRGMDYTSEVFNEAGGAHLEIMAYAYKITGDKKYLAWGKARMQLYALFFTDAPGRPWDGAGGASDMAFYFLAQAPVLMKQLKAVDNKVAPLYPIWRYQAVPRIVFSKEFEEQVDFVIHYHNTNTQAYVHFKRLEPTLGSECGRIKKRLPLHVVAGKPSFRNSVKLAIPGSWEGECEITFENVSEDFFLWVPIEVHGRAKVVYTVPDVEEGFPLTRRGSLFMGVLEPRPEMDIEPSAYWSLERGARFTRPDGTFVSHGLKNDASSSLTMVVDGPLDIGSIVAFSIPQPNNTVIRGFRGLTPFFACSAEQFFMPKALKQDATAESNGDKK